MSPKVVETTTLEKIFPTKRPGLRKRMLEESKKIIQSLEPGQVKLVGPDEGERVHILRNWMVKAAKELGVNIQVRKARGKDQLLVWKISEEEAKTRAALREKMREKRVRALEKARAAKGT